MEKTINVDDMSIFRFLRRAAINNSIFKKKYAEWVEERLNEVAEDTIKWVLNPLKLKS